MPPGAAFPNAGDTNDGLPEWLRPLQPGSPPPNYAGYNQSNGAASGYGQPPQQAQQWQQVQQAPQWQQAQQAPQQQFSMGSLVNEDALPEWLRQANANLPPQVPPSAAGWGAPAATPQPAQPQYNSFGAPAIPSASPAYGAYGQNNQYGFGASGGPAYGAGGMPQGQPLPSAPYSQNSQMPPGASFSGSPNAGTSASTLFDESALPDWMRQAGAQSPAAPAPPYSQTPQAAAPYQQMPGNPNASYGGYQGYQGYQPPSQPAPQPPSNAFPSIDRAGAFQPAPQPQGGLSGQSLLDPGALPQWLGGQAGTPAQGGQGGTPASGGMAAQSLVDESALPQWLRAQPDAPAPAASSMPAFGAAAPAQPSGWGATPAAEEPLPTWLSQVYSDAKVPRTDALHQQASANPWGANSGYRSSVSGPLSGGFGTGRTGGTPPSEASGVPASQFVDESALPEWLRAQGAAPMSYGAMPPAPPMPSAAAPMPAPDARAFPAYAPPGSGGAPDARPGMSFSASDLIDPDVLPQWVRGENGSAAAGNSSQQQATFSSTAGWSSNRPSPPGSGLLLPPPGPAASASSWQQSGVSDQLSAWQSETSSSQGGSRSFGALPPGSGPLRDDSAPFGGGRRQGGGIPVEELPPWLQQAEPPRAPNPSMDAGRQRMPDADPWNRAPQQQEPTGWDDGYAEAGADFAWDDNQNGSGYDEQGYAYDQGAQNAYDPNAYSDYDQNGYDPNGYDPNGYDPNAYDPNGYDPNGYDQDGYEYDAPPEADERAGGWRRLFGR